MTVYTFAHNRIDITPTKNNGGNPWMAGYGWRPRASRLYIANRKLYADCIAIKPDSAPPLVMVRLDVVSIPPVVHNEIRDHVVTQGHTNVQSFMMVSSHTHSGPVLPESPDPYIIFGLSPTSLVRVQAYSDWLVAAVKQLVDDTIVELAGQTEPVTLKYDEGTTSGLVDNRSGFPDTLPQVPILAGYRGTTKAFVLFGYAAHPVCRGDEGFYDSDYPGVATKVIEDALGCPALFFLGCAGDQNPLIRGGNAETVATGNAIAHAVLNRLQNGLQSVDGDVVRELETASLPLVRDTENATEREALIQAYKARKNIPGLEPQNVRFCDQMLAELGDNTSPNHVDVPIQCWKFGTDFAIMGIGGEVISRYDTFFRSQTQRRLWVMGYANAVPCYICDDKLLWVDRYESGWTSTDGPTISGFGTSMMPYAWPVPMKASPTNTTPPAPGTAEHAMRTTGLTVLG
ncbi:hypothetical protein KIPE111705_20445 [Kibdelosporangium persicum]|uniref:Ceramidase n=1 Tax=Kibdelosporangium persicum TaxID=2698649 RepID=A0ABX2FFA9_9PSEU|nr:hypothetical protein [Kibdelosporangium persicum]NRN70074.1 hypothetical protein [Kibdelosporangium persicum]